MGAEAGVNVEEGAGGASGGSRALAGFSGLRGALSVFISCICREQSTCRSNGVRVSEAEGGEGFRRTSLRAMKSFSAEPALRRMNVQLFYGRSEVSRQLTRA